MLKPTKPARRTVVHSVICIALLFLFIPLSGATKRQFKNDKLAADSFEKKVDWIKQNAHAPAPDPKPTIFSQEEINAYFAERRLTMPEGVKTVAFDLKRNLVTANTRVDFDQIRNSRSSMNPLLAMFGGVHDCTVVAHAEPAGNGMVHVRVESVAIDGMEVPRIALEMFVKHYVNPKYPNVGLDNDYRLPARIEMAQIADQSGTVIQK